LGLLGSRYRHNLFRESHLAAASKQNLLAVGGKGRSPILSQWGGVVSRRTSEFSSDNKLRLAPPLNAIVFPSGDQSTRPIFGATPLVSNLHSWSTSRGNDVDRWFLSTNRENAMNVHPGTRPGNNRVRSSSTAETGCCLSAVGKCRNLPVCCLRDKTRCSYRLPKMPASPAVSCWPGERYDSNWLRDCSNILT